MVAVISGVTGKVLDFEVLGRVVINKHSRHSTDIVGIVQAE